MQNLCNRTPFRNFRVCEFIALAHSYYNIVHGVSHAHGDVRKFRNCAQIVVAQLYKCRRFFVRHCALRLQGHQNYRNGKFFCHCRKSRRGCVSHHIDKEKVEVRPLDFVECLARAFSVIDKPERKCFYAVGFDFIFKRIEFFEHYVFKAFKLFPICIEPDADYPDICSQRLSSFYRAFGFCRRHDAKGACAKYEYDSFHCIYEYCSFLSLELTH